MKVILNKINQAVKQLGNQLSNRRCSSANGLFTSEIVGAVTSLIFVLALGLTSIGGIGVSNVSAASTITVSSSGAQSIDVLPGASGVGTSIGVDEITVNTTCRAGYNFSISTSVNDNNLYLNGNSSNNESGKYFTPSDGTTSLGNSTNTWGYYYSSSAPTTAPTSANIFPAVPSLSSAAAIIKTPATTASSADISDSFNIYYGVSASSNLVPGTYKMIPDANNSNADGSIVYYVTMDTSCDVYTISYDANDGSGSVDDQLVPKGDSAILADNAFTRTNHYFMGWSTSQNATTPEYRTNQTITPTNDMTLYAVWGDSTTTTLYDAVASLTKGAQPNDASTVANTGDTIAGIQAAITKANSGVYTYDANTYGAASDAATTNPIYYYRGILDTNLDGTTNTYGTNGDGMDYPNYVILDADGSKDTSDACWRIVRTTGSGGVKMIYNGTWTGSTCANATTNAQVATQAFNATSNIGYKSIIATGYTFNANYKTTTDSTAYSTLFGSNTSYSGNSTPSSMKTYIENTWFTNINSYSSILEPSAGYCNDRTIYTATSGTGAQTAVADSYSIVTPYTTASSDITQYYFGARIRTGTTVQAPTLGCPRSNADLYTTSSASDGNKQLAKPAALITADEAAFAGSGYSNSTTPYHANSYLRSGSYFWLLSPYNRVSNGVAVGFALNSSGSLDYSGGRVYYSYGVRPAISLASGTTATSGSGTATNPWVVTPPPAPGQCTDTATCMQTSTTCDTTLTDARDGNTYTVATINGACWMTQNLRFTDTSVSSATSNVTTDKTLTYYSLASADSSYSGHCDSTNSYNYACIKDSGSTTTGVWYNYAAATAGTITGSSNNTDATEDICPAGWHLPAYGSSASEAGSIRSITSYSSAFSPVTGGRYYNGSLGLTGYGRWWSAPANTTTYRYYLNWSGSSLSTSSGYRYYGYYVRCVRS